jgi:cyanate lyase
MIIKQLHTKGLTLFQNSLNSYSKNIFLCYRKTLCSTPSTNHISRSRYYSDISGTRKEELAERLQKVKEESGVTYDDIAKHLQVTNVYAAQLLNNQAQLKPGKTTEKLKSILPNLTEEDVRLMQRCPRRSFDPQLLQEPLVYRLVEAMQHYGLSIVRTAFECATRSPLYCLHLESVAIQINQSLKWTAFVSFF